MKIKSYTELFIFIVTAELVGALSALITGDFSGFFNKYSQPPLLPPAVAFIDWQRSICRLCLQND